MKVLFVRHAQSLNNSVQTRVQSKLDGGTNLPEAQVVRARGARVSVLACDGALEVTQTQVGGLLALAEEGAKRLGVRGHHDTRGLDSCARHGARVA